MAIAGCDCHYSGSTVDLQLSSQHPLRSRKFTSFGNTSGRSLRLIAHARQSQRARSERASQRQANRKCVQSAEHRPVCCSLICSAQGSSGDSQIPTQSSLPSSPQSSAQDNATFLRVPWGWKEIGSVLVLWLLAFWLLGSWLLPTSLEFAGFERDDLSRRGQALVHLLLDFGQLGLTLAILYRRLKAYRPRHLGWFHTHLLPIQQWLPSVLGAACMFPILNTIAQQAQMWCPSDGDPWAQTLEQSIVHGDPCTNVLYFVVVTFCAPIWEEAMFRGFLLPSFRRYMPMPASLLLTSAVFAMAHFSLQRLIPLVLLGLILGAVYLRTRNLLAPVVLHSLWNMYIFWNLLRRGAGVG